MSDGGRLGRLVRLSSLESCEAGPERVEGAVGWLVTEESFGEGARTLLVSGNLRETVHGGGIWLSRGELERAVRPVVDRATAIEAAEILAAGEASEVGGETVREIRRASLVDQARWVCAKEDEESRAVGVLREEVVEEIATVLQIAESEVKGYVAVGRGESLVANPRFMPRVSVRPSWPTRGESVESVREDFPEGTSVVFREKLGSSIYIVGEIEREDGQKGVNLLDPIRVEAGSDNARAYWLPLERFRNHVRKPVGRERAEEVLEILYESTVDFPISSYFPMVFRDRVVIPAKKGFDLELQARVYRDLELVGAMSRDSRLFFQLRKDLRGAVFGELAHVLGRDKGEMSQKWREHLRELPAETLNEEAAERLRGEIDEADGAGSSGVEIGDEFDRGAFYAFRPASGDHTHTVAEGTYRVVRIEGETSAPGLWGERSMTKVVDGEGWSTEVPTELLHQFLRPIVSEDRARRGLEVLRSLEIDACIHRLPWDPPDPADERYGYQLTELAWYLTKFRFPKVVEALRLLSETSARESRLAEVFEGAVWEEIEVAIGGGS